MKIRIFALAKELGVDSKDLIQQCNDAGLDVKSSPLASISPAERDVLMQHLRSLKSPGTNVVPETTAPSAVSRDEARREAAARELRTLSASQLSRVRRGPRADESELTSETEQLSSGAATREGEAASSSESHVQPAEEVSDSTPESMTHADSAGDVVESASQTDEVSPEVAADQSGSASASVETPAPAEPKSAPANPSAEKPSLSQFSPERPPAMKPRNVIRSLERPKVVDRSLRQIKSAASASEAKAEPTPVAPIAVAPPVVETPAVPDSPPAQSSPPPSMAQVARPAPLSRSDYINPTGGSSTIREMRPHGTVRPSEDRPVPVRPQSPVEAPPAKAQQAETPANQPPRREKRRGPALPSLATPNFKPAVVKKTEELVQKPDLALTGDVLRKNKLADILKKNRDDAVKRPSIEEEEVSTAKGKTGRTLGLEESREARRRRRQKTRGSDDDDRSVDRRFKRNRRGAPARIDRKTEATLEFPITVRSMSEALGRPARDLISIMFKQGQMLTINDSLDEETAIEIAMELGVDLKIEREENLEDVLESRLQQQEFDTDVQTEVRPPIITILGHVDHGKTTLVDRIRSANVAAGEAGGITQHIAAYQVNYNDQKLTFVDTPGHAAFGEMRARGANVTDIIVLVVAANDGVMPQTVECISHAKAAGVPIVVAMNKMDLPNVNEQRVLTELSQHGILPTEWGGDVEVVRVSGLTGLGVDNLLETLLLTAEIADLRAPVNVAADGVCLEAFRDEGRGPIAWGIVRQGTLRIGDLVLCGPAFGRVRAMYNDRDEEIREAGPSTPLRIAGLDDVPGAGDHMFVMEDIEEARQIASDRKTKGRDHALAGRGGPRSLEDFFATKQGAVKDLPLVIKADTPGSLEAIRGELDKFEHPEVRIKILHQGVGGVNESDVYLAASAGAIIIAFHVVAEDRAEALAGQTRVEIRRYKIIYNVTSDIRQALEGLLIPEKVEVTTGRALVLRTFSISRTGTVAGCRILNGTIDRNSRVHVIRDQTILNNYALASLKREKDDAKEVREGFECGIRLDGFNDIKEGDLLEAYRIEERRRSLDE